MKLFASRFQPFAVSKWSVYVICLQIDALGVSLYSFFLPVDIHLSARSIQCRRQVYGHALAKAHKLKSLCLAAEKEEQAQVKKGQALDAVTRKVAFLEPAVVVGPPKPDRKEQGTSRESGCRKELNQDCEHITPEPVYALSRAHEADSVGEAEPFGSPQNNVAGRVIVIEDASESGQMRSGEPWAPSEEHVTGHMSEVVADAWPVSDDFKQTLEGTNAKKEDATYEPTNASSVGRGELGEGTVMDTGEASLEPEEFGLRRTEDRAFRRRLWTVCEESKAVAKNALYVVPEVEPTVSVVNGNWNEEGKNTREVERLERQLLQMEGFAEFAQDASEQNWPAVHNPNLEAGQERNDSELLQDRFTEEATVMSPDRTGDAVIHDICFHGDPPLEFGQKNTTCIHTCITAASSNMRDRDDADYVLQGNRSTVNGASVEIPFVELRAERKRPQEGEGRGSDRERYRGLFSDGENHLEVLSDSTDAVRVEDWADPAQEAHEGVNAALARVRLMRQTNGQELASNEANQTDETAGLETKLEPTVGYEDKGCVMEGVERESNEDERKYAVSWGDGSLEGKFPDHEAAEGPRSRRESERGISTASVVLPHVLATGVCEPSIFSRHAPAPKSAPFGETAGDERVFAMCGSRDTNRSNFSQEYENRMRRHVEQGLVKFPPFSSAWEGRPIPGNKPLTLEDLPGVLEVVRMAGQQAEEAAARSKDVAVRVEQIVAECRSLCETVRAEILRAENEMERAQPRLPHTTEHRQRAAPNRALPANAEIQNCQELANDLSRMLAEMREDMNFRKDEMEECIIRGVGLARPINSDLEGEAVRSHRFKIFATHAILGNPGAAVEKAEGEFDLHRNLRGPERQNGSDGSIVQPRWEGVCSRKESHCEIIEPQSQTAQEEPMAPREMRGHPQENDSAEREEKHLAKEATVAEAGAGGSEAVAGSRDNQAGDISFQRPGEIESDVPISEFMRRVGELRTDFFFCGENRPVSVDNTRRERLLLG
ncbi:conserved hypothetical protein [Neospora caninum Liverpool]|uniref:Uncharacterized protein n=1 Tax=Neospora caninum (strain Liverpool) TaxID=572307 RepID=F0VFY7_NEOCL|nr:conserved hypothetical protein [Neospora caninum Liverpool]CBZ52631.1 conserved hypothetical protein [Neospora caninum Liverpool]|eukprot:XP_003882663.1 conserved hypothetical protein [Neospora caninum Liverpool]